MCCISQFHVIFINALAGHSIACFSVKLMKLSEITSLEKYVHLKCIIWKIGGDMVIYSIAKMKHSNRLHKIHVFV